MSLIALVVSLSVSLAPEGALPAPGRSPRPGATPPSFPADSTAGRYTRNVEPLPGVLWTSSAPPWLRTMPRTADSPSPRPVNFVEKNGSKMRSSVASSIPHPVSVTSRHT